MACLLIASGMSFPHSTTTHPTQSQSVVMTDDHRTDGWAMCAAVMQAYDEETVKGWNNDIDTLLVLVCLHLFLATVHSKREPGRPSVLSHLSFYRLILSNAPDDFSIQSAPFCCSASGERMVADEPRPCPLSGI
jgi:hypothetical protein